MTCLRDDESYTSSGGTIISILQQLLQQPSIMIHHRNQNGKTALEEVQAKSARAVKPAIQDVCSEIIRLLENWDSLRRWNTFCFMMQMRIRRAQKEQGYRSIELWCC
jgi:hypothetical protein